MRRLCFLMLCLATASPLQLSAEDPGLTATSIRVGQAAPLSGAASGLGTGMSLGLKAWAGAVNTSGGIHGRTIDLVTVDDTYDPEKCADATAKLIEEDQVFCLAGYVGTPTAKAAIPVLTEAKVPLVGAFTGAGLLRKDEKTGKPHRYVVNLRASYGDETETLVHHLVTDLGAKRIAVFHQNDAFGQAGLTGTLAALKKRGMELAGKGSFERGTSAVQKGLLDIQEATPDAVIMVGPYAPVSAFLKEAKAVGLKAAFATVSFVGTENLIKSAGLDGEGVIISQVVPSPEDTSIPLIAAYQTALKATDAAAKPGYVSLEGYATGRLLGLLLTEAGKNPTREGLMNTTEGLKAADLDGFALAFGADDHQASDRVYLTRITAGSAKSITSLK
jgi:branched-chain amino acid transport system substrate-binding protein